jgi:hypothetical protein
MTLFLVTACCILEVAQESQKLSIRVADTRFSV